MASAHFQATDYLEAAILRHLFSIATLSLSNLYLALSTTTPTEAGGNFTEPSGSGYARVLCNDWDAPTQTTYSAAASPEFGDSEEYTRNTAAKAFPAASGSWGTPTYAGLFDASTAGNLLWYGPTSGGAIASGQIATYPAGNLRLELEKNGVSGPGTFMPSVRLAVLNHLCLRSTYTPPNPLYLGLCTGSPPLNLPAETYNENTDGAYSRFSMSGRWTVVSTTTSQVDNSGSDLVWGPAVTSIGAFLCLFDASSGGNLWAWCRGPFSGGVAAAGAGETMTVKAGGIHMIFQ